MTPNAKRSVESRNPRRSTDEVRALIVDAATQLFAERGYPNTTMRDIASTAGVGLSVLYRQFASKERLFSATFVAPFLASFQRFGIARTGKQAGLHDEQVLAEFVLDLHRNVSAHRRTIITLLAASEDPETELVDEVRASLEDAWRHLQLAEAPTSGAGAGTRARMRDANMLVVAMIVGLVVFQPWISAIRRGKKDDALVKLAALFASGGIDSVIEA